MLVKVLLKSTFRFEHSRTDLALMVGVWLILVNGLGGVGVLTLLMFVVQMLPKEMHTREGNVA